MADFATASGGPRIWVDCTSTARNGLNTGIQRVVRNIARRGPEAAAALGVACLPVVFDWTAGFVPAPVTEITPQARSLTSVTRPAWAGDRHVRDKLKALARDTRVLPLLRNCRDAGRIGLMRAAAPLRAWRDTAFRPGDILLLADSPGDDVDWGDLRRLKARGVRIGAVVYDVIPLTRPEDVGAELHFLHRRWLRQVAELADFVVAISRSVRDQIPAIAVDPEFRRLARIPRGSFRLGADLDAARSTGPDQVASIFGEGRPVYLMVGTMNPRKGHETVLNAFEQLWRSGRDVALLIAGKYGWLSEAVASRVCRHTEFGRRLYWFEGLDDAALDGCYRRAAALVTASTDEGFNLPIVESLSRGRPVLASDLPVHREVAGPFAAFFPGRDPRELARLVATHVDIGRLPGVADASAFRWPDWTESTRELLAQSLQLSGAGSDARAAA